jgi:glyoxylase-like metal-dependent hydrolase (beta-lactamase superfamily II)
MSRVELISEGVVAATDGLVNWYLVEGSGGVLAVDAGLPGHWSLLHDALALLGREPAELKAIVLTHAHSDHTGFAPRAQRELGAAVHVHSAERRLLAHPLRGWERERSPLRYGLNPSANRALVTMLRGGAARPARIESYETFEDGAELEALPGSPRIIATPGHTRGHCCVLLTDRDVLVTGDALVTFDPYTGNHGPRLVARGATWSSQEARASLERIERAPARVLAPGHGPIWRDGAVEAVRLARAAVHG